MSDTFPFLIYRSSEQDISVNAVIRDETVWLTQKAMTELFGVESNTITYHLKEIFKTGELIEGSTTRKFRAVQKEGKRRTGIVVLQPQRHYLCTPDAGGIRTG